MYSNQMLCLVTPDFAPGVEQRIGAARAGLDAALRGLKFVHFASVALLPGRPGNAHPPSLMLELVIDDGIEPADAIGRLLDHTDPGALWSLYSDQPAPDAATMRAQLRGKLLPLLRNAPAHGGFVGMRDRTATQVRAEARYFLAARERMRELREAARAAGERPAPAQLVQRLVAALSSDAGQAAMGSASPRSFWCRPRAFPSQLLLALIWVGLPVPLLVVALASVGAVFNIGVTRWPALAQQFAFLSSATAVPAGAAYLVLVASAAAVLLFGVFLLVGLLRAGGISMSMLLLILSALGVGALYVLLLGNVLRLIAEAGHGDGFSGAGAALRAGAALVLIVAAWMLVLRLEAGPLRRRLFRLAAAIAAGVVVAMIGLAGQQSLQVSPQPTWRWLHFALPAVGMVWLFVRSQVVRWMLLLAWLLLPLLLLVAALATMVADRALVFDAVWKPSEIMAYFTLGALAHVSLALLVGVLFGAAFVLALRRPWWPLGLPLLALTLLLAALSAGVGAIGVWVYESLCRELPSVPDEARVIAYLAYSLAFAVALALAGAFVQAIRWLAAKALPSILKVQRKADRNQEGAGEFRPCIVPDAIVENEAALAQRPSHMISLTEVRGRPRGFAAHMLRLWLHVIGQAGHVGYTRGFLGSAWGIKFGHWHVLDDGRRLLFISNYDGPFGGYLDEFIQGCSQGINLIWRWTELRARTAAAPGQPEIAPGDDRRYPKTWRWAFRGCHHEQQFKAYARASMVPHLYLFQAYDHSNLDIRRATTLRDALAGARTPENDDLVLRILES